jgi:hypothetical protein
MNENVKRPIIDQSITLALKVLERWLFEEMKVEEELYKMRGSNQKKINKFQILLQIYLNVI